MPIVAGAFTMVHSEVPGLGDAIEAAQLAALEQAWRDGVSVYNGPELQHRKSTALKHVLEAWGIDPQA